MDQWIKQQISSIPDEHKRLVTAHDAFGYFSKRYDIHVIGLQGISTAMQANTKDIQDITNTIIKHNVPTILLNHRFLFGKLKPCKRLSKQEATA